MLTKKIAEIQARRASGEKGFTLVELLVVVVIIAVLAAIAVPIFLNQRDNAEASANKSTISAISKALATAQSTGGYAAETPVGTIAIRDGSGATVTVPKAGATVRFGAATPGVTSDTVTTLASTGVSNTGYWCVQLGGLKQAAGETSATAGSCPTS